MFEEEEQEEIYRWEINRDKERDIVLNAIKRSMSFMGDNSCTDKNIDCEFFVLYTSDILRILRLRIDSEKEHDETSVENWGEHDKEALENIKNLKQAIKLLKKALPHN